MVVIGGKNSAAIAALELWRHRRAGHAGPSRRRRLHRHVKYWIKPDIENRIKNGEIKAYFRSEVVEIAPDAVTLETPEGARLTLHNDFVFAMTGYHPDFEFLEATGRALRRARQAAGVRSGDAGEQRAGDLSGGRDRGRFAHQRDFY